MDQGARYLELCRLGRETFLRSSAGAALIREAGPLDGRGDSYDEEHEAETTLVAGFDAVTRGRSGRPTIALFPLIKKPGAPFPEMITVGRTANNDVALNDVTVSRFHAYFKGSDDAWIVCDSGSKNGTSLDGESLDARKETKLSPGSQIKFGEVEIRFYTAAELFDYLCSVGD